MSKEVKEGSWESRGAQKHKNSVVCEISQPKIAPCEIPTSLRNNFAAPRSRCENTTLLRNHFAAQLPPLRKFSQLRNTPLAHECHFAAQYPHFATAKWLRNLQSVKTPTFAVQAPFCKVFRSCETTLWHTSAILQPRTLISQLQNGCEILHTLKSFSAHTMNKHVTVAPPLDTFLKHLLELKLCILYLVLKLGKSGVQCFKRCTIWI